MTPSEVVGRVRDHSGPHALGPPAQPAEARGEDPERGDGGEDPVREREDEGRSDDRDEPAQEAEHPHAEAAVEDLLDERRRRARRRAAFRTNAGQRSGDPFVGGEALLLARVEDRLERGRDDERREHEAERDPDVAQRKAAQAERPGRVPVPELRGRPGDDEEHRVDDRLRRSRRRSGRTPGAPSSLDSDALPANAARTSSVETPSHAARAPFDLDQGEGVLEVGDDVVCILTPYGDAEHALGDAGGRQLLGAELPVARRRRDGGRPCPRRRGSSRASASWRPSMSRSPAAARRRPRRRASRPSRRAGASRARAGGSTQGRRSGRARPWGAPRASGRARARFADARSMRRARVFMPRRRR